MHDQSDTELDRLLTALSVQTHVEAAGILGIRRSVFSDSKRRGGIVAGTLLERALEFGIRHEWLKEGRLPMRREKSFVKKCPAGRYCTKVCPALEAVRRAAEFIAVCPHICGACEHNRASASRK